MIDNARVARRVNGRQQAKDIVSLLNLDHQDKIDAFFDELRSLIQPKQVEVERAAQKRRLSELSSFKLRYGIHADVRLDDVPRDYLHWLVGDSETTVDVVREYLEATKHLDADDD